MSKKRNLSRRDMLKTGGAVAAAAATTKLLPGSKAEAAKRQQGSGGGGMKTGVPRLAMVIDLRRCIGCRGCTVSCKAEFSTPLGVWNTVVKQEELDNGSSAKKVFLPRPCNHCTGMRRMVPPCVDACPESKSGETLTLYGVSYTTGATYKRPDGLILYDNSLCIGCGECITACPYGVRYFNPFVTAGKYPSKNGIGKCTFCQHRIDNGVVPSCVNTCQGRARIFGDLNDPNSEVSKLDSEFGLQENRMKTTLLPEEGTKPNVFYIDPDNILSIYEKGEPFIDQVI